MAFKEIRKLLTEGGDPSAAARQLPFQGSQEATTAAAIDAACGALARMAETALEIGRRAGEAETAGRPLPALRATSPEGGGKAGGDKPLPYGRRITAGG